MSKKSLLCGVLIGAGLVTGGVIASKNEKVKSKVKDLGIDDKVDEFVLKGKALGQEGVGKIKNLKKGNDKGKDISEDELFH